MKNLSKLTTELYKDCMTLAGVDTHPADLKVISQRCKREGVSFLTMTLPSFEAAFTRGLESGALAPHDFPGFRHRKFYPFPTFLSGLVGAVFSKKDGTLLDKPNVEAIWAVRQICLFYKKVEVPCSDERIRKAYEQFEKVDREVLRVNQMDKLRVARLADVWKTLYARPLAVLDREIWEGTLIPKHGPGAVAEGFQYNEKFQMPWYQRLSPSFPMDLYASPNLGADNSLERTGEDGPDLELPAKVIHVPKTSKTPRMIAIEPACMQFAQQAIWLRLRELLEKGYQRGDHTLQFSDQEPNGRAALLGSKNRNRTTIDLSNASDRLSSSLVSFLLKDYPHLKEAVYRCRSGVVSLPLDGAKPDSERKTLRIRKFATSGSALCFPIESMVFYAIATLGVMDAEGTNTWPRSVNAAAKRVLTYGDDIVVPAGHTRSVLRSLEAFGLEVNYNKTFFIGRFRESCGVDAYDGVNITPVYLRSPIPEDGRPLNLVESLVNTANGLHANGMWSSADFMRRMCDRIVTLPLVMQGSETVGHLSHFQPAFSAGRWNNKLHQWEVKGLITTPVVKPDPLDGYDALLKFFLSAPTGQTERDARTSHLAPASKDPKHLEQSVKPRVFKHKHGWTRPY